MAEPTKTQAGVQALIERLKNDGVKSGKDKAEEIIKKAKEEAARIKSEAKAERDALLKEAKEAIEKEIQSKIARAIMIAEMQNQAGSVPASIKRHFSDLSKPKVNWRVVLKRFLNNLTNDDYSWRKPNRKYLPHYLPKLHSTSLGRIDFAIDTSGSINEKQFTQFIAEVHAVLRMLNPKEIGVYQFDSVLQGSDVVRKATDLLKVPFSGGGGTNPQAALTEFEKNNAMGLIILTDGEFYTSMLKDPQRPVIWVVYNNPRFVAPFGTTVHFNLNEL